MPQSGMAHSSGDPGLPDDRRAFFAKVASTLISVVIGLVPLGAGLAFLLDPLRRRGGKGRGFLPVASLDTLPEGVPRRYRVVATHVDAWSRHPQTPIGAVYLLRLPAHNDQPQVRAFQVICPHAGCSVQFDADDGIFRCPCHGSTFAKNGTVLTSPSERDLDELDVEVQDGNVLVRYQEFRAGGSQKVPVA